MLVNKRAGRLVCSYFLLCAHTSDSSPSSALDQTFGVLSTQKLIKWSWHSGNHVLILTWMFFIHHIAVYVSYSCCFANNTVQRFSILENSNHFCFANGSWTPQPIALSISKCFNCMWMGCTQKTGLVPQDQLQLPSVEGSIVTRSTHLLPTPKQIQIEWRGTSHYCAIKLVLSHMAIHSLHSFPRVV